MQYARIHKVFDKTRITQLSAYLGFEMRDSLWCNGYHDNIHDTNNVVSLEQYVSWIVLQY